MFISGTATIKRAHYKQLPGGHELVELLMYIPTTVPTNRKNEEYREDMINGYLWGKLAHAWDEFKGRVSFEGDLRISRYKRANEWKVNPEINVSFMRRLEEGDND